MHLTLPHNWKRTKIMKTPITAEGRRHERLKAVSKEVASGTNGLRSCVQQQGLSAVVSARPWSLVANAPGLTAAPTWKWKLNQVVTLFAPPAQARHNADRLTELKYLDRPGSGDLACLKAVSSMYSAQVTALSTPLIQPHVQDKHNSERTCCFHEWASKPR